MKVEIKDREIDLHFSFRAEIMFELINGKSFVADSMNSWVTYMFCVVIALTEDGFVSWDEFLDWLDNNNSKFYEFIKWYSLMQSNLIKLTEDEKKKETPKRVTKKK